LWNPPSENPKIIENSILTGNFYHPYPPKKKLQQQPEHEQQTKADDRQALALLGLPIGNFAVSQFNL
jgi:hypothetical protein